MDPAAIIMAVTGGITGIGGVYLSRRGQRDTQDQQQVANEMAVAKQRLKETQQVIDAYAHMIEVQRGEIDRLVGRLRGVEESLYNARDRLRTSYDYVDVLRLKINNPGPDPRKEAPSEEVNQGVPAPLQNDMGDPHVNEPGGG